MTLRVEERRIGSYGEGAMEFLCQNCVTYPLKPPVNAVIYEDISTRIDVA
jgi:hypothetical protein